MAGSEAADSREPDSPVHAVVGGAGQSRAQGDRAAGGLVERQGQADVEARAAQPGVAGVAQQVAAGETLGGELSLAGQPARLHGIQPTGRVAGKGEAARGPERAHEHGEHDA